VALAPPVSVKAHATPMTINQNAEEKVHGEEGCGGLLDSLSNIS
jgi:hypothetical protein